MSSIIEGYNYDIFISYRQKDNKGDRWVSQFVEALKTELESTFKEEITVYFDINPHDGLLETHDVDGKTQEEKERENKHVAAGNPMPPQPFTDMKEKKEGFENLGEGPAQFGNAEAPAGCYPRDQLTPSELLPKDPNSVWAQQNPMGTGSLKGKNFLSAGALIGVNTVGQSLRNANYQLRSEPPNPQVPVSVFNQTTIEPDINRRTMEIN
jgi:hypothetical protein